MRSRFLIIFILIGFFLIAGAVIVLPRYLREMEAARAALKSHEAQVVETDCGPVEYARTGGDGPAVLVIHGAMGGFDQGLLLAMGNIASNYRIISVSRFGYLGSPRPENATLTMQADAYACLLDELGIEKAVVFATSAGATSAIRFTARYPEHAAALILLSPAAPGPKVVENPPLAVFDTLLRSDFVYWSMVAYFKPFMRKMVGVPEGLALTPEMEREADELLAQTLPASGRMDGMISDFTLSPDEFRQEIRDDAPYPLKNIDTPVLVIDALDDPLAVPENVHGLAAKFPNARLVVLPDGGHPGLGHREEIRNEISSFMAKLADNR